MTEVCSDLLPVAAAERVQAGAAVPGDGAGLHLRLARGPHPHRQAQGQAAAAAQVRGVNMTASSHDPALVVVGAFSMIVKTDGPFAALLINMIASSHDPAQAGPVRVGAGGRGPGHGRGQLSGQRGTQLNVDEISKGNYWF